MRGAYLFESLRIFSVEFHIFSVDVRIFFVRIFLPARETCAKTLTKFATKILALIILL